MATPVRVAGLLLAAGSGRRYGRPKALVDTGAGPWVRTSLDALRVCDVRVVVVGAGGDEVADLLPNGVHVVANPDHDRGMGSSLRRGLAALAEAADVPLPGATTARPPLEGVALGCCDAVVVHLVDLPGVGPDVVSRLIDAAGSGPAIRGALLRAGYGGVPGHPVLLGRDHWAGVDAAATGDSGARTYFEHRPPLLVECGDIASGDDIDEPPAG